VLDVLKGRPSPTVRVAFLDPRPPRWYDAPLFTEGQEGLWLLRMVEHTREWRELETVPKGAYSALHPLDAQAPSLFGRVHALTQLSTSKQRRKR